VAAGGPRLCVDQRGVCHVDRFWCDSVSQLSRCGYRKSARGVHMSRQLFRRRRAAGREERQMIETLGASAVHGRLGRRDPVRGLRDV